MTRSALTFPRPSASSASRGLRTLTGALAVITGGRKGVGLALGKELAKRGARIVIASVSDATAAVEELRTLGADADWYQVDVADRDQVFALADWVRETHGSANIVVNNAAGGGAGGSLLTVDPDAVRRSFDVNVLGYIWVTQAFGGDLTAVAAAGGPAHLLNVGSEHALGVPPYVQPLSIYTITKQAGLAITETTRRDLAGTGVNVSLVAPGWVLTETVSDYIGASDDFRDAVLPYAQSSEAVARLAIDGMLEGRDIIVTNPKSAPFARMRAESIIAELYRSAPTAVHAHDGTGDIAKCPVVAAGH